MEVSKYLVSIEMTPITLHSPDGDQRGMRICLITIPPGRPTEKQLGEPVVIEETQLLSLLDTMQQQIRQIQAQQTPRGQAH